MTVSHDNLRGIAIFLAGTSQVGKTDYYREYLEAVTIGPRVHRVIKEGMAARDIREQIGNPTWSDLCENRDLMLEQQNLIMDTYERRCIAMTARFQDEPDFCVGLFERSLYDNVGYTYAFLKKIGFTYESEKCVQNFTKRANDVLATMERNGIAVINLYEPIRHEIPYDTQQGARPPVDIRMLCEQYLEGIDAPMFARQGFNLNRWYSNRTRMHRTRFSG